MNLIGAFKNVTLSRTMHGAIIALLAASSAKAAPIFVQAEQDQGTINSFVLDFGGENRSEANIASTTYELEVDAVAGTARFLSYEQEIPSLILPDGTPTGAIHVSIITSDSVGFDLSSGQFQTSDMYRIRYENDLSMYGLPGHDNPAERFVDLPSTSIGTIDVISSAQGGVFMQWSGEGVLLDPFIQGQLIGFEYTCTMNVVFSVSASSFIALELMPLVTNTTMANTLKTQLMNYLNASVAALDASPSQVRAGVAALRRFITRTRAAVPSQISVSDAEMLISKANEAIRIAQYPNALPLSIQPNPQGMDIQPIDAKTGRNSIRE